MGQKDGEKWTAAVDSQPALPKSDRLLGAPARSPARQAPHTDPNRTPMPTTISPTISPPKARFVELLQELFQLNQPEPDLGLYRIVRARSKELGRLE